MVDQVQTEWRNWSAHKETLQDKPFYHPEKLVGKVKDTMSDTPDAMRLFDENADGMKDKMESIETII